MKIIITPKANRQEKKTCSFFQILVLAIFALGVFLPLDSFAQTATATTATSTTASTGNADVDECMKNMKQDMEKSLKDAVETADKEVKKAPPVDLKKEKGYCLDGMLSYFNAVNAATTYVNLVQSAMQSLLNQLSSGVCNFVQAGVSGLLSNICITMPGFSMPNLGLSNMAMDGCNSGVPLLTMSSGKSIPVPDMSGYFKTLNNNIINSIPK